MSKQQCRLVSSLYSKVTGITDRKKRLAIFNKNFMILSYTAGGNMV